MSPLELLRASVQEAAAALRSEAADAPPGVVPTLERPKRPAFGDFSTNAAMLLAPSLGKPPRDIAERLGDELATRLGPSLERWEVAGPGFLNLFLADRWFAEALTAILAAGEGYGGGGAASPEKILVEFVSANPTGPLHVGHARNAAYGDALARILAFHGHAVSREFYSNDFGSQVLSFGASIQARARGDEVAEDGYRGEYVRELAREIPGAGEDPVEVVARRGVELMLERTASSLRTFGVEIDSWFSERTLHQGDPDPVRHAFLVLEEQGRLYRSEGALWLRTTAFGDDKDRVLERSSGEHTYFASDIAYHQHKRERGFDRLIDVWGADHHGYVGRMKVAYEALGGDPAKLELLIMQFVHLVSRGERASMSKRAGEFVSLDDLIAEIGTDSARWFLLQRSHDTTIDLDLDLARSQEDDNPAHYVKYAHARIHSLLARGGRAPSEAPVPEVPLNPAERALVLKLATFEGEVGEAAERRAPHRVCAYALELAQTFTAFYRDCRVVGAEPESVESFRLALCVATWQEIRTALALLGVSAPDSM